MIGWTAFAILWLLTGTLSWALLMRRYPTVVRWYDYAIVSAFALFGFGSLLFLLVNEDGR